MSVPLEEGVQVVNEDKERYLWSSKWRKAGLKFRAFPKFEVPRDEVSIFNKIVQRLLSHKSRKHSIVNMPIEVMHVIVFCKTNVDLSKLEDKCLKLCEVFANRLISLLNFSDVFDDVVITVKY